MITSPVVRGFGGKWNIGPWIISHFPEHGGYVEPYCGGAAILFRKPLSDVEIINDLNGEILNFFDVLRGRADELIQAVELTPYSRAEHQRAMILSDDPLERARRFYIRSQQSFSSGEATRIPSWRFQVNGHSLVNRWNKTSHLWVAAHRLKNVQLECDTAEAVIKRFDGAQTLFYVDPPYVHSTRTSDNDYAFEMSDAEHIALAEQLSSVKGMVVLSGYDCPLYRELYAGWQFVYIETDTVQKTKRTECLWINERAQAKQAQKRLF